MMCTLESPAHSAKSADFYRSTSVAA